MKMKKTLIAAAVASVCAAPIAANAASVGGEFIAGIENGNDDYNAPNDGDTNVVLDTAAISAEGGEDLGNGLRVDAGVAFEGVTPTGSAAQWDSGFGTLSGDFGSLTLGFGIDSVYYLHVYSAADRGIIYDTYSPVQGGDEAERTVQYGFSSGPFSLTAGVEMDNSGTDNASVGGSGETETIDRIGIGASFDAGVVTVGVAHQSSSSAGPQSATGGAEPSQTGFSVSGDVGPASVGVQYSMYDQDVSGAPEPTSLDVNGSMDFGGGLGGMAGVSMVDADTNSGEGDTTTLHAQLSQSLSSRTYVFGQLMSSSVDGGNNQDTDPRALFVGMGHEF